MFAWLKNAVLTLHHSVPRVMFYVCIMCCVRPLASRLGASTNALTSPRWYMQTVGARCEGKLHLLACFIQLLSHVPLLGGDIEVLHGHGSHNFYMTGQVRDDREGGTAVWGLLR